MLVTSFDVLNMCSIERLGARNGPVKLDWLERKMRDAATPTMLIKLPYYVGITTQHTPRSGVDELS